ncbi:hypothetical protein KAI04_00075 [Candidatus Pacearchaeota archaeon]|nr:hypothetical protein [Candidatus Pacearchaeota archaeon]
MNKKDKRKYSKMLKEDLEKHSEIKNDGSIVLKGIKDEVKIGQVDVKVSPLDLDRKKKIMINYIFNEDDVHKTRTFTQTKFNENLFGYGIYLPKNEPVTNKVGEVVSKEQIWKPVIISSDRNILEVTKEMEQEHKIKFDVVPDNINLRWSLESINEFLKGEGETPDLEPKELFDKVEKQYGKYIFEHNPIWNKINSLWDIGTYFYQLFDAFPISEKRGMQETAKSKRMEISKNLSFNSTGIMINPSEATLFRESHEKRPTKYFDEAEKLFRWNQGQMEPDNRVELINGSYKKGSAVPRVEKINNRFKTIYYNTFSPCMISSIKGLFGATESRCITQICTRSPNTDSRGEMEIVDSDIEWSMIRDYLYLFSLKYWKNIEINYRNESFYSDLKLKKRDLQIWKPLLAISKLIDDELFLEISTFAEKMSGQRREDFIPEDSFDYKILKIIKDIIQDTDIIRPKEVRKKYIDLYGSENVSREKGFSTKIDNLGFREYKEPKDRDGAKYIINSIIFESIINPICPNLVNNLSQSSQSSQLLLNKEILVTNPSKSVTKGDELIKKKIKSVTNVTKGDECDDEIKLEGSKKDEK